MKHIVRGLAAAAALAVASGGASASETFDITLHGSVYVDDGTCNPADCISTTPFGGVLEVSVPDGSDGFYDGDVKFSITGGFDSTNYGFDFGYLTIYAGRLNSAYVYEDFATLQYGNDTMVFQTHANHDFIEQITAEVPEPSASVLLLLGVGFLGAACRRRAIPHVG